jgi:CubicO group peptidase (beta-lactamase class C family)
MCYKFHQLAAIAVFMALVTACDSTAEEVSAIEVAKSESAPTVSPSAVHTAAPPTVAPRQPSATATVVVLTSSPVPKPTEVVQVEADTMATNVVPVSSPTPLATSTTAMTTTTPVVASSSSYRTFSDSLQEAFQTAVDTEFAAAVEKASLSVAVYTDNTMWTYAVGTADTGVDISVDTPILIGSTSKTFVSALVLTQIENGFYSLNDSIGTVLLEHPDYASFDRSKVNPEVTIRELLSMTSGLADYNENIKGKVGLFSATSWKPADNINLLQSPYEMPGAFEYVDTNLVLLGLIAELHGGQDLYTLYRTTFLDPLRISAAFLSPDTTPPNTARPYDDLSNYSGGFGNLIDSAPYSFEYYITGQGRIRWACCGIISTPQNIVRWAYELYSSNGKAISESSRSILFDSLSEDPVLFQGSKQNYGYFIAKRTFTLPGSIEVNAYGHPGGGGGYSSLLRYSPQLDLAVSVLANSPLKFQGACEEYAPRSCIAAAIFGAYTD